MSHELRTPLTSVVGFAGLLKASANLPETERRHVDRIATASEALLSVINDILDYSKLEADAADLEPQPFDPRAMAEGTKILMADDAAPNRELVTAIMRGLGLDLRTVCDGAEAVEAARTGVYDLILMDVQMPFMDGLAATRAIRAMDGSAGRTPIIALTANIQPEQVERCLAAGMNGHVGKPIQMSVLLNTMAAFLERDAANPTDKEAAA